MVDEGRRAPPADRSWVYRGTVRWLTPEEGGRTTGPPCIHPTRQFYGANAYVPPFTARDGLASFLLRRFEPGALTSPAEGRWLRPGLGPFQHVEPDTVVIVTEGLRPVARFLVTEVLPGDAADGVRGS
jgi:hypothetical protein